jgi:hypothetical protein
MVAKKGTSKSEPVELAGEVVEALEKVDREVLDWKRIVHLDSAAEYERCGAVLIALKEQLNNADKERKEIVDPLNGVVKHVNQRFKTYIEPRKELESHLKSLMKGFLEEQRQLALVKAENEAKKAEKKGATQLAIDIRERALTSSPVPVVGAVSYRDHWTFKVVDEKKVPREYMCVDEEKLRKLAGPDAPKVPGIEFVKDTIVAVSA